MKEQDENKKDKTGSIPEGFNISLALADCLPVLFFSLSIAVLMTRFHSLLFAIGAILVILAGALKVTWKFVLALARKNIMILNRQMRYLMPAGFIILCLSLLVDRGGWSFTAVLAHVTHFPSALFFLAGIAGMTAMTYFAKHFDSRDVKNNWIEQCVNAAAQCCFFLGILL